MKPGEDVHVDQSGHVQVQGQVAVMAINGLLTKTIFDHNPTNEFYVEESFPLDWMFPNLTPFGVIMKINREPLPMLTNEIIKRDHEFLGEIFRSPHRQLDHLRHAGKGDHGVRGKGVHAPRLHRISKAI